MPAYSAERISIVTADITEQEVDAIVNVANRTLLDGVYDMAVKVS